MKLNAPARKKFERQPVVQGKLYSELFLCVKEDKFDSSEFSAGGMLISVSAVFPHRIKTRTKVEKK